MIDGANSNNLFMQCDKPYQEAFKPLPEGFTARLCRRDELIVWKTMWAQGKYMDFVDYYYDLVYAPFEEEFFDRCLFAVDENDKPVATAGTWLSYRRINTVLWFHTLPEYEGRGIGRGLFSEALRTVGFPLYVHTHPIAYKAVKLYSDFGFKLITDPAVGYRENNLQESLPYLKKVLPDKEYARLMTTKANHALLEAALLSETAEF
jgi:GNAT superfamily N-acetyltransferase